MVLRKETTKRVPNFTFPSDLSDKLWKSMQMTPKKLVCEKEFYERILVVPQQKTTVWECVSHQYIIRNARAPKAKAKGKVKAGSCPPSSPQGSTSASKSRKAKLLAGAVAKSMVSVPKVDEQDFTPQKQTSTSGSGSPTVPMEDSAHGKGVFRDSGDTGKSDGGDTLCDGLEWGGSGRRRELGSTNGPKGKSGLGKRKAASRLVEGVRTVGEAEEESRPQEPLRVKLRKVDPVARSSPSAASDKSSKEHCGFSRRDSARVRSEVESGSSSLGISDQALALKLHYAMNPRPTRRRSGRFSGDHLLDSPKVDSLQLKCNETPESSS